MSVQNFDIQIANSISNVFNELTSVVLWVRSLDDQQALYVSRAYERIWGRPCQSLYDYPNDWQSFLIHDEKQKVDTNYFTTRDKYNYRSTLGYRIRHTDGEPRWILDHTYALTDSSKKPIAMVGFAEMIYPSEWDAWLKHPVISKISQPMEDMLAHIKQEFKWDTYLPPDENGKERKPSHLTIDNTVIPISNREWDVLVYLQKGYSAKQTAYELNISPRTVECYLDSIRRKAGCRNKLALISKVKEFNF